MAKALGMDMAWFATARYAECPDHHLRPTIRKKQHATGVNQYYYSMQRRQSSQRSQCSGQLGCVVCPKRHADAPRGAGNWGVYNELQQSTSAESPQWPSS